MGIKGFGSLIANTDAKQLILWESLCGCSIAVDLLNLIHILVRAVGDNPGKWLLTFLVRLTQFKKYFINAIFVLDGERFPEKSGELLKRKKSYDKDLTRLQEVERIIDNEDITANQLKKLIEEQKKLQKRTIQIDKKHIDKFIELIQICGFPYIHASTEGEFYCAWLYKQNIVDFVFSEDSDTISCGAPMISSARHIKTLKNKSKYLVIVDPDLVIVNLELTTQQQLTELCILCGSDFKDNLRGIGAKKALNIIRALGDINTFTNYISSCKKYFSNFDEDLRKLFNKRRNKILTWYDIDKLQDTEYQNADCLIQNVPLANVIYDTFIVKNNFYDFMYKFYKLCQARLLIPIKTPIDTIEKYDKLIKDSSTEFYEHVSFDRVKEIFTIQDKDIKHIEQLKNDEGDVLCVKDANIDNIMKFVYDNNIRINKSYIEDIWMNNAGCDNINNEYEEYENKLFDNTLCSDFKEFNKNVVMVEKRRR
jgi:5'-3' exonuclease